MKEVVKASNKQKLCNALVSDKVALFNNTVFHKYRVDSTINILKTDGDYYIKEKQIWDKENKKYVCTRVSIYNVTTHHLEKTVDVPYVNTVALLSNRSYRVIRKAESDTRVILIRSISTEDRFYEIKMGANTDDRVVVHRLSDGFEEVAIDTKYANIDYDGPIYYKKCVYLVGYYQLHYYDINKRMVFTFSGDQKRKDHKRSGSDKPNKAIWIDNKKKMLMFYWHGDRSVTQIDLRTREIVQYYKNLDMASCYNILLGMEANRLFFVYRQHVIYFDLAGNKPVFIIDIRNQIINRIDGYYAAKYDDSNLTVQCIKQTPDNKYLAIIFFTQYNKYFVIYNPIDDVLVLSYDMIEGTGFPIYHKNKMAALGFDIKAIDEISKDAYVLHNTSPLYRKEEIFKHIAHSKNNILAIKTRSDTIRAFDMNDLMMLALDITHTYDFVLPISFAQDSHYLLYLVGNGGYGGLKAPKEMMVVAYNTRTRKQADVLDVTKRIGDHISMDCDFSFPAIRYKTPRSNRTAPEFVTIDKKGKLQIKEYAKGVADINKKYYVREGEGRKSLHIYTKEDKYVTTIVLKDGFSRCKFSSACEDLIYTYNYGSGIVERYNILEYIKGDTKPEINIVIGSVYLIDFSYHFRESMDGQKLFVVGEADEENEKTALSVYDIRSGKRIARSSLEHLDVSGISMGPFDSDNHFITIVNTYKIYFIDPLTFERKAEASFYSRGHFLFKTYLDGEESKYFYTNMPEMISVYQKDANGKTKLLDNGDIKRMQYLEIYNNRKKVRDIIMDPKKAKEDMAGVAGTIDLKAEYLNLAGESYPVLDGEK